MKNQIREESQEVEDLIKCRRQKLEKLGLSIQEKPSDTNGNEIQKVK